MNQAHITTGHRSVNSQKGQRTGVQNALSEHKSTSDNLITRFFEKKNLGGLVEDHEGKYSFLFDDHLNIDLALDNKSIHMECLLCEMPLKIMTKDRLLADLAKNTVLDMKYFQGGFFLDSSKKYLYAYRCLVIDKNTDESFEQELGRFLDFAENYKKLTEKILRMGELSEIPVEFRLEQ